MGRELESNRHWRDFAPPKPWVGKPTVGGLGKDLVFSYFSLMPGLSCPLLPRVELGPMAKSRFDVTESLFCSLIQKIHRSLRFTGEGKILFAPSSIHLQNMCSFQCMAQPLPYNRSVISRKLFKSLCVLLFKNIS